VLHNQLEKGLDVLDGKQGEERSRVDVDAEPEVVHQEGEEDHHHGDSNRTTEFFDNCVVTVVFLGGSREMVVLTTVFGGWRVGFS